MAVPRRAKVRTPAHAAVFIEPLPTRVSPLIRGILAAPACDSPRYRCHSHPLALVLISHDPAAPRGCFTLVRFSITLPITQGAHARARRSLHRASSNPSQPPYPRHSRRTGLRQPSLPLPQPPARPRADQSRPRCTSRVLYARSVLDYSSYHSLGSHGGSTQGQGAHARARRSLHRASSNPSQPPYPRHSRRTGLRQPSLPLPQPPARPRADQSRPRCTSRVLYARSVLDYSSYHLQPLALLIPADVYSAYLGQLAIRRVESRQRSAP